MTDHAPTAERLAREQAYHDHLYSAPAPVRAAQHPWYAAVADCRADYRQAVIEACRDRDVLEYGCGRGVTTLEFAPVCRTITGIDLSPVGTQVAAEAAAAAGIDNAHFRAMDAERLDFPDASFDVVIGQSILHHLNLDRAYHEIQRVLRPGGVAIFIEPLGHNPLINAYRDRTPEARTPDEHPLLRSDMALARRHFSRVELSFSGLFTLAAVPLAKLPGGRLAGLAARGIDRLALALPGVRWLAWFSMMRLYR